MAEKRPLTDTELEALFSAAASDAAEPSEALMRRVLADADGVADGWRAPAPAQPDGPGLLARLLSGLGGWPGLAGLATAGVAGLAIGIASPGALATLSSGLVAGEVIDDYHMVDLLPGLTGFFDEG